MAVKPFELHAQFKRVVRGERQVVSDDEDVLADLDLAFFAARPGDVVDASARSSAGRAELWYNARHGEDRNRQLFV